MSKEICIGKDEVLASAGLPHCKFLHLIERNVSVDGRHRKWWLASRQEKPAIHSDKKPDAVIICAFFDQEGVKKVVLTSEYRIPLGAREIGMPAGLIDEGETAEQAAVREFREETGLDLVVSRVSPPNLYSSAGMTNESVQIVFGDAFGEVSKKHMEEDEDIEVIFADMNFVKDLVENKKPELALSAKAWCLLHGFVMTGF